MKEHQMSGKTSVRRQISDKTEIKVSDIRNSPRGNTPPPTKKKASDKRKSPLFSCCTLTSRGTCHCFGVRVRVSVSACYMLRFYQTSLRWGITSVNSYFLLRCFHIQANIDTHLWRKRAPKVSGSTMSNHKSRENFTFKILIMVHMLY